MKYILGVAFLPDSSSVSILIYLVRSVSRYVNNTGHKSKVWSVSRYVNNTGHKSKYGSSSGFYVSN